MERVGILINKLQEQFVAQVESDKILVTAQMLLAELQQHKKSISMTDSPVAKSGIKKNEELSGWLFDMQTELPIINTEVEPEQTLVDDQIFESVVIEAKVGPASMIEVSKVKEILELNDLIVDDAPSIHDQLKQQESNISTGFQETPIRDLKKAIGINDRYLFINELFRGDETMYERSLKTINGFAIFPEAQYWIQRELKVKLGWNDRSEAVDHFHQLVKRRFA
jgi:hypothetical protein